MAYRLSPDDPQTLRLLGSQCRSLARGASTRAVAASLDEMAADYERAADRAEAAEERSMPRPARLRIDKAEGTTPRPTTTPDPS